MSYDEKARSHGLPQIAEMLWCVDHDIAPKVPPDAYDEFWARATPEQRRKYNDQLARVAQKYARR